MKEAFGPLNMMQLSALKFSPCFMLLVLPGPPEIIVLLLMLLADPTGVLLSLTFALFGGINKQNCQFHQIQQAFLSIAVKNACGDWLQAKPHD